MEVRLRKRRVPGMVALVLVVVLAMLAKPGTFQAFAGGLTEYSGLPVEKKVDRMYYTVRNTIQNPSRDTFCVFTRTKSTSYAISGYQVKMRARAATENRKLVKTGSWKWNTQRIPVHEECWQHMVLTDNRKICSYGQMQSKKGTALTGVITPPPSPLRS